MNDMSSVIVPKSDQINADDLISGDMTITIRDVQIKGGQEQPVSIFFNGSDKAFRPCKSMSRVLVAGWGADAKKYVGRTLQLYRDPTVKWGGLEVGGIRIRAMSDIDREMTLALTATKGSRKPYTVKPLANVADEDRAKAERWLTSYLANPVDNAANQKALAKLERHYPDLYAQTQKPPADDWTADDSNGPAAGSTPEAEATTTGDDAAPSPEGPDDGQRGDMFDGTLADDPRRKVADALIAKIQHATTEKGTVFTPGEYTDYSALPEELAKEVDDALAEKKLALKGGGE